MDEQVEGGLRPVPSFFPPWKEPGFDGTAEGFEWTEEPVPAVGLFDRDGREIDALTYDDLRNDRAYSEVAREVAFPTVMGVLTIWVGVPIPAAMFSTAVHRFDADDYVTVSETHTEEQALWVHELAVDAVRRGVELRDGALLPAVLRKINPGTPGTICRCPGMDNGYGRNADDWKWWVKSELCLLHWYPEPVPRLMGT